MLDTIVEKAQRPLINIVDCDEYVLTSFTDYSVDYDLSGIRDLDILCNKCGDIVSSLLSDKLRNFLQALKHAPDHSGLALVKGIPVSPDLGLTPTDNQPEPSVMNLQAKELLLIGLAQQLGDVFSYYEERGGGLVQNICPARRRSDEMSSEGSNVILPLHTEDLHFYPCMPRFVFFMCLREEPGQEVSTNVVVTSKVISRLSQQTLSVLQQPIFYTKSPPIFRAKTYESTLMPIINRTAFGMSCLIELVDTRSVTKEGEAAIEEIKEVCASPGVLDHIYLKKGDLLILDNYKVLHGRSNFRSQYSGNSRWCQRVLVSDSKVANWDAELIDGRRVLLNEVPCIRDEEI